MTFTGFPAKRVGEYLASQAAVAAAERSSGCPDTACAANTFPSSSISTCTVTVPPALAACAAGGYDGFGSEVAFPLSTPPLICFGMRGGVPVSYTHLTLPTILRV